MSDAQKKKTKKEKLITQSTRMRPREVKSVFQKIRLSTIRRGHEKRCISEIELNVSCYCWQLFYFLSNQRPTKIGT